MRRRSASEHLNRYLNNYAFINGSPEHLNEMVREHPAEVRRRVVELWRDGNNLREIQAKTDVSLGSISSIINEEKSRIPDIEQVRKLLLALKKTKSNLQDALRGAVLLEKLNTLNIQVNSLPDCIRLLDQHRENAGQVLTSAIRLGQLEEAEGKSYDQIMQETTEKARQLDEIKTLIRTLQEQKDAATRDLQDLEKLRDLNEKMSSHSLSLQRLDNFIDRNVRLEQLGFTPEAAELLASELAGKGLDPKSAATALTRILTQYESLERALPSLQTRKVGLEEEINRKKMDLESVTKQSETLKSQVNQFNQVIKNQESIHQAKTHQLKEKHRSRRDRLEAEINNLKTTRETELRAVQEQKDEVIATKASLDQAQTAIERIEKRLAKDRPLATIAHLIGDPKSPLEPTTVIGVAISFLQGIAVHLRAHPQLASNHLTLQRNLDEVIRILAAEYRLGTRKVE